MKITDIPITERKGRMFWLEGDRATSNYITWDEGINIWKQHCNGRIVGIYEDERLQFLDFDEVIEC